MEPLAGGKGVVLVKKKFRACLFPEIEMRFQNSSWKEHQIN